MFQLALLALFDWDDHYACAPEDSPQWASTDRGWVGLLQHPDATDDWTPNPNYYSLCCGNYLRYPKSRGPEGQEIHACAYVFRANRLTGMQSNIRLGSGWFFTVTEAKTWIEDQVTRYLQTATTEAA